MAPKSKQVHRNTCGAKTRAGTPCKLKAGYGTDHLGTGRCKYHGGCSTGPPKGNKNAEKHGLFSKHLPKEALDIVEEIESTGVSGIEILWQNIKIQYAAILRSQKIMWVKNKEDHTKELKKETEMFEEFETQYSWDKQASFLKAQSRAMAQLSNMISKYEDLVKSDLATEEQKLRIEKLKVEVEKIQSTEKNNEGLEALAAAINKSVEKISGD